MNYYNTQSNEYLSSEYDRLDKMKDEYKHNTLILLEIEETQEQMMDILMERKREKEAKEDREVDELSGFNDIGCSNINI